jgi:hypothetical protein
MADENGLNALTGVTPERTAAIMVLMHRLAAIEPIGFPLSWDRSTAVKILSCLKDFLDAVGGEEIGLETEVSPFASEVLGDLITHILALGVGQSDPRLYPQPGGGSPAGTVREMRGTLLAAVRAKAEQYKTEGVKDFKAKARRELAELAQAEGWKWPVGDREREIDEKLLKSWEKGLNRANWSGHG